MDKIGNPNLTKILFTGLIVTFLATTIFGAYLGFASLNNATIEEPYKTAFQQIGGQYANFTDVGNTAKDQGLVKNILNFGGNLLTGTVNVFVVGLQAMGSFFAMIPIIGNILSAITVGIPALSGLVGLALLIVGVYIAMRYIQSISNKFELP